MKKAIIILSTLCLFGCGLTISDERVKEAAESAGYADPQVVGRNVIIPKYVGCGRDDHAKFEVIAKKDGRKTKLTLCCGALKGCTVRY